LDKIIKTKEYGSINVSVAFGGDTFIICNASDFNLKIEPKNAKEFVNIGRKMLKYAKDQVKYQHPTNRSLKHISFC